MSILTDSRPVVEPTIDYAEAFEPSRSDLEDYGRWLATRSDLAVQAPEPTPVELLICPADPEDLDDDGRPWWISLPECPELDTPIGLDPEAEPVTFKMRPSRFSSPDRYSTDVAGDPDRIADGYHVIDTVTGQPVAWRRYLTDAKALAEEISLHTPRSRASNWNPERDAIGLD